MEAADHQEDKDAELAALQAVLDEHIASSTELEEELEEELKIAEEKLAETTAENTSLKSQLENVRPQLMSLERALATSRSNLEIELSLRRQAELSQDEAETKARVAEGTIASIREECDAIHEDLAFKEVELEELRVEHEEERERHKQELENERERHRQELQELRDDIALLKRADGENHSHNGGMVSPGDDMNDDVPLPLCIDENEQIKNTQNNGNTPCDDNEITEENSDTNLNLVPEEETENNQHDSHVNPESKNELEEKLNLVEAELVEYKQKLAKTEESLDNTEFIMEKEIEPRLLTIEESLRRSVPGSYVKSSVIGTDKREERADTDSDKKVETDSELADKPSTEATNLPEVADKNKPDTLKATTSRMANQVIPNVEAGVKHLLSEYNKVREEKNKFEMLLTNLDIADNRDPPTDLLSITSDKTPDRSNRAHRRNHHKKSREGKLLSPRSLRNLFHIPHWHRNRNTAAAQSTI